VKLAYHTQFDSKEVQVFSGNSLWLSPTNQLTLLASIQCFARNFHRVPNTPRQAVRVCIDDAIPGSHIVMVDGKGAPGRAVGYRIVLHLAGIVAHLKQELGGAKQQRVGGAKVI
jgi:hypothetical protein